MDKVFTIPRMVLILLLSGVTLCQAQQAAIPSETRSSTAARSSAVTDLQPAQGLVNNQSPAFIENRGQWDSRVRFLLQSGGLNTWITDHGVVYDLHESAPVKTFGMTQTQKLHSGDRAAGGRTESSIRRGHVVSINFLGSSPAPTAEGAARQPGHHNYFIGNDTSKWARNVPLFGSAQIAGIYPGIDALFYLDEGSPRYDLVVSPGADPARIRMSIDGATAVAVTPGGSLTIATSLGAIEQRELFAYQEIQGARRQIACRFMVDGNEVRFDVGSYDRTRPLVIDPLVYSTYLGGSADDIPAMIAVDGSGSAYVTGFTYGSDFPTTAGAWQSSCAGGGTDAFVTKINSDGSIAYSTYLGGSADETGYGVAVDGSGNAYVTGATGSADFPTYDALQSSHGSIANGGDAYVTKFDSDGAMAYSTYLGGNHIDFGAAIAVDGNGSAYVAGYTVSSDFPVANAYQSQNAGGYDVFLTKLGSDGSALVYSTLLGGTGDDLSYAIAVDANANAYVSGYANSTDFPTSSAFQSSNAGGNDGIVARFNSSGSLVYSTYVGGTGEDYAYEIAVDGSANAYISGATSSTNFPTSNALQSSNAGGNDAFVTKLNSSGNALVYSSYLGGSGYDQGDGIAVDAAGNLYLTGFTSSTNFPTSAPFQSSFAGGNYDAFVTKLTSDGATLAYSTYLGGSNDDIAYGLAIDGSGSAYVTGTTNSTDFPTLSALQASHAGGQDGFVTRLAGSAVVTVTAPDGGESWCAGSTQLITWTSSGITNVRIELSSDGGSTFPTTIVASTPAAAGSYSWSIPFGQAHGSNYRVRISDAADMTINDIGDASFTIDNSPPTLIVSLSPTTLWPPNNTMRAISVTATASDNCGSATWVLTSITGNDGATNNDYHYMPNSTPTRFDLRARRLANGGGRTYVATFTATDASGNTTTATANVFVPHDLSRPVIDGATTGSRLLSSTSLPNPFTTATEIRFTLARAGRVKVRVVDLAGSEVATLLDAVVAVGDHATTWNGENSSAEKLPSGIYLYLIEAEESSESGRMVLSR